MRKTWTDTDAQRLRSLREQAGTDLAAFAKRHALSVGQVRELEGGKPGSFYSDDIKAHAGRRLLAALGYVGPLESDPPPEPEPIAAPGPDLLAVAPAAAQAPDLPPDLPPEAPSDAPSRAPDAPRAADAQPQAPSAKPLPPQPAAGKPRSALGPLVILAFVAAVGIALVLAIRDRAAPGVSTVTVDVAPAPTVAAAASAASPEPVASAAAPASAALPASAPGPAASAPALALPVACELAASRAATQYTSPVADKPATYVYVEAIQEARVCVFDSRNQARAAVLKPGESFNFSGVPPFTVRSPQWTDLKVFFQGLRVQLEPGAGSDNVVILPRRPAQN